MSSPAAIPLPADGLGESDALRLLKVHGPNQIPPATHRQTLAIFLAVLREPMFLLRVAAVKSTMPPVFVPARLLIQINSFRGRCR